MTILAPDIHEIKALATNTNLNEIHFAEPPSREALVTLECEILQLVSHHTLKTIWVGLGRKKNSEIRELFDGTTVKVEFPQTFAKDDD